VVGLVYLVTTAAYLTVPAIEETIVLPALLGEDFGRVSMVLADLLALAVLVVATNAWVFGASRVLASASRRGLLPRSLAVARTGTPARALLTHGVGYTVVVAVMAAFGLDETPMLLFTSATFLVLYVPVAVAALRDRPSRALRVSASVTLVLVACFLPSTAAALPAVVVLVVLMWLVAVRRSAAVDEAVPHQAIGGKP
jgi:amino acid efflux transporter